MSLEDSYTGFGVSWTPNRLGVCIRFFQQHSLLPILMFPGLRSLHRLLLLRKSELHAQSVGYRITSKYSNTLQTSQICSFAKRYHILHPKVSFKAPWLCARCGIKSLHDVILHPSLNQCWKSLLFEYLAAIRYVTLHGIGGRHHRWKSKCTTVLSKNRTVTVRHHHLPTPVLQSWNQL